MQPNLGCGFGVLRSLSVLPRSKLEDEVDLYIPFSVFHDREKMKDTTISESEIQRRWNAKLEDEEIPKARRPIAQ